MLEANHDLEMLKDGPYPWPLKQRIASRLGHLSNESFLDMLPEILHEDVRHMVVGHMSQTNNDPRLLTLQIKRRLRQLGLTDLPFTIARQDEPMETLSCL
jgi:phosphoribosyl 1,2-cyclic phosphodiesterase